VSKDALALDAWLKEVAPSDALRRWFSHDRSRWKEFVTRYRAELRAPVAREAVIRLVRCARQGTLTLIYGARDETQNNAVVLSNIIGHRLREKR
jgi:uncharacterized protein YeaO (DUF488 family)